MKQSENVDILDQPIARSLLSIEFKSVTETLGFYTFADLLEHRTAKLLNLPGLTQQLIYEYVDFLELNQMGHLIDP